MTHNQNSSQKNIQPESNLFDQSPSKSVNNSKVAKNICLKLGISLSLAAAIHLPSFNQAAEARDLTNFPVQSLSSTRDDGFDSIRPQNKIATLLPRILSLITSPVKSRLTNSPNNLSKFRTASVISPTPNQTNRTNVESEFSAPLLPVKPSSVTSPPRIHQVQQGETLNQIARKYQVSRDELIKLNKIPNSNIIFVDQRLKIPATAVKNQDDPHIAKLRTEIELLRAQSRQQKSESGNSSISARLISVPNSEEKYQLKSDPGKSSGAMPKLDPPQPKFNLQPDLLEKDAVALILPPLPDPEEYLPRTFDGYIWPAQGELTSGYGWRWGRLHQGIDIAAPVGTPVLAAASGKVVSAGWHDGYGNMIKLEHLDGSVTLYAHLNRILVNHGQKLNQGEQIAEMGNTGYSTGSHLHFEIHSKNQEVINPLALLGSQ